MWHRLLHNRESNWNHLGWQQSHMVPMERPHSLWGIHWVRSSKRVVEPLGTSCVAECLAHILFCGYDSYSVAIILKCQGQSAISFDFTAYTPWAMTLQYEPFLSLVITLTILQHFSLPIIQYGYNKYSQIRKLWFRFGVSLQFNRTQNQLYWMTQSVFLSFFVLSLTKATWVVSQHFTI